MCKFDELIIKPKTVIVFENKEFTLVDVSKIDYNVYECSRYYICLTCLMNKKYNYKTILSGDLVKNLDFEIDCNYILKYFNKSSILSHCRSRGHLNNLSYFSKDIVESHKNLLEILKEDNTANIYKIMYNNYNLFTLIFEKINLPTDEKLYKFIHLDSNFDNMKKNMKGNSKRKTYEFPSFYNILKKRKISQHDKNTVDNYIKNQQLNNVITSNNETDLTDQEIDSIVETIIQYSETDHDILN